MSKTTPVDVQKIEYRLFLWWINGKIFIYQTNAFPPPFFSLPTNALTTQKPPSPLVFPTLLKDSRTIFELQHFLWIACFSQSRAKGKNSLLLLTWLRKNDHSRGDKKIFRYFNKDFR